MDELAEMVGLRSSTIDRWSRKPGFPASRPRPRSAGQRAVREWPVELVAEWLAGCAAARQLAAATRRQRQQETRARTAQQRRERRLRTARVMAMAAAGHSSAEIATATATGATVAEIDEITRAEATPDQYRMARRTRPMSQYWSARCAGHAEPCQLTSHSRSPATANGATPRNPTRRQRAGSCAGSAG